MTFQEEMQAAADEYAKAKCGLVDPTKYYAFDAGARAALNSTLVKELEAALEQICERKRLRDVGLLASNPVQNAAVWDIQAIANEALKALRDARGDG